MAVRNEPIVNMQHFLETLMRRLNFGIEDNVFRLGWVEESMPFSRLDDVCVVAIFAQDHCFRPIIAYDADLAFEWVEGLAVGVVFVYRHSYRA